MSDHETDIKERLNRHPMLKSRTESLLNIAENAAGDINIADHTEFHVIQEIISTGVKYFILKESDRAS